MAQSFFGPPPLTPFEEGGQGAKKSDLTNFLTISDHFLKIFSVEFFLGGEQLLTPPQPLLHDDRGDGGDFVLLVHFFGHPVYTI